MQWIYNLNLRANRLAEAFRMAVAVIGLPAIFRKFNGINDAETKLDENRGPLP